MNAESSEIKALHWSEQIAEKIIKTKPEPYVITGGMTTSGPTHLGTVCEFLFPQAIVDALSYVGKEARYYFVADIADSFDSIPAVFSNFEEILKPHLGKPLFQVPDPTNTTSSFGEYFLLDAIEAMKKLSVYPQIVRANELYLSGAMDYYANLFLKEEEKVRQLIAKSSLREKLPDWWSPIMPTCEKCGKNATTRVIKHNISEYEYACDRDVGYTKGCGYLGRAKISDHLYKLTWRLHWPAWQDYFKTSAEGGGVDHFTRGGSRDSLEVIFREIFKKEPPIGYKFGFILFNGKKYSKSKGQGIGISELMQLLPPEIIKYMLLKPDLQENIDIVPSGKNFLRLIEDYEKALELIDKDPNLLSKADRKRMLAAKLSSEKQKIRGWKTSFLDLILYRNLQLSWDKIAQKTDENSVQKLSFYIENWEKKNFIPDEYHFKYSPKKISKDSFVYKFFANLETKMSAVDIHNFAFVCAKEANISPAKFFEECYLVLLGKPVGPKLGKLIEAIGIEKVKADLL